ncbi:RNA polymerase subunit sigma-70 [Rhizobium giardinii]|uniref:RNA polymerase subunit sigma-70 n=1 Tax=Rhizobium giardinii TaxID=56731 RepID=UPI0039E0DA9E
METPKSTHGRPRHDPTGTTRRLVTILAAEAIPQSQICVALGVDGKTLRRHYRAELDRGSALVEAKLALRLFQIAGGDDDTAVRATAFALQCRFGWSRFAPPPRA